MGMAIPLVIDTREQLPLDFSQFQDIRVVRAKLWPGDYSLQAGTHLMAIERKSVSDLIGTMKEGYAGYDATSPKRFDAELLGLGGVIYGGGRAFVLVEPDVPNVTATEQIDAKDYRADIPPSKIWAFIERIRRQWRVPVILTDSRRHSAQIVASVARAAAAEKAAWKPVDEALKAAMYFKAAAEKSQLC